MNIEAVNNIPTTRLDRLNDDFKYHIFTAKKSHVDYVYNAISLEDNPMTYIEVKTLLEGTTVGGHHVSDSDQVINQNKALSKLIKLVESKEFSLSVETFNALHYLVAYEEALTWGEFRTSPVLIGGTEYAPPHAKNLPSIFDKELLEIEKIEHPVLRALSFFLWASRNQFYFDGNKRTSRLMANGVLLSNSYPVLNIASKDRLLFNKIMIDWYNSNDIITALESLSEYYFESNSYLLEDAA